MNNNLHILLADDDDDDCLFFQEALNEINIQTYLSTVNNGMQLMCSLKNSAKTPDIIFLDLNMPLMSGFECIAEIKADDRLKHIPIIIFSTSFTPENVHSLFNLGALFYIRKPGDFKELKQVIYKGITSIADNRKPKTQNEFVIYP